MKLFDVEVSTALILATFRYRCMLALVLVPVIEEHRRGRKGIAYQTRTENLCWARRFLIIEFMVMMASR